MKEVIKKNMYTLKLCVLVTQLYPTVCDPVDCSPPGSSVDEILQARILEWDAISCSNFKITLLITNRKHSGH